MNYGPLGLIKSLIESLLEALDPYPNKRRTNVVHGDKVKSGWSLKEMGDAQVAAKDDLGDKYWQDRYNQRLDEKEKENERITEMLVKDYEERHGGEINETPESAESGQDAAQDNDSEAEDMGNADFTESCDFESGDSEGGDSGYTGYIG
jgi:hypothetical protein